MYGPYLNEELVGRAIQGRRDQVILATKFGIVRVLKNPKVRGVNGKPAYVRSSCEGSLRRLNVDTIDLYYQHRVDPDTPIEENVAATNIELTADDLKQIAEVAPIGVAAGPRHPEHMMKLIGR